MSTMNIEKKMRYEEPKTDIRVFYTTDILTAGGFHGEWEDLSQEGEDEASGADVKMPKVNF